MNFICRLVSLLIAACIHELSGNYQEKLNLFLIQRIRSSQKVYK